MLDDLRFRLRALFRRDDVENDLDDELRFHLERATEQHVARGLSPREAYRQAQLAFGPIDFVKEDCRRSWGIRQLDALRQDGTFALRLIRKHPALSAISAISLAIGIGLNTTLFALLDATLLRRLPIDRPEQLVDVYTSEVDGFAWYGSSYPDYLDLRRGVRALSGLVGYVPAMGAVRTGDRSRAMPVEAVTGNYFQALGVPAAHGRVLLPEDDRPGAPPVVVVSSAFWSAAFDRDPAARDWALRVLLAGRQNATVYLEVRTGSRLRRAEFQPGLADRAESPLTVAYLDDRIGYVRLHDSLGQTALVSAWDAALDDLRGTDGLILDLRDTPSGGNTTVARGLLGRLVSEERPYQRHELSGEERRHGIRRIWVEHVAPRGPRVYGKPIGVLVGRWTASMGEGVAIGLDGMKRATVFGSAMAGLAGAVYGRTLEYTGFPVRVPAERLYHVDGTPREKFVPQFRIEPTSSAEDTVLEAALRWMRRQ